MTSQQIRQSFLDFFEQRGHRVVPSSPVIPHGDPTLLFTNAGMNQFKDVFLATGKRDYVRAVDTQKCIRVSGKHNDLEEVGRDTYHHTFFEMLGNWSFGDYYKKEAIEWAWELLTNVWGLEKRRLYATVFETDDEAAELWAKVTDIDPTHIQRFSKKDNFWEMGDTGPCGPCSEIHIDLTPDLSGGHLVNAGDARVMEIWNLVFIQNNRKPDGELEDLPAKHVDTGAGFERICAVLQGKSSNYDTDVFMPIIHRIELATNKKYGATQYQSAIRNPQSEIDVAMRVIADHIRMLTFSITDGAIPGNEGRGYVLRRILRRAARFGRNLGMREPFIYQTASAVVESMGKAFPEIVEKQSHVERVIKAEEESFNATLDRGLEIFETVVERIGHSPKGMPSAEVFPGEDAFKLYDTFGFPLDLTQLMAEERGLHVDVVRFTELMEEQRDRSRKSRDVTDNKGVIYGFDGEPPLRPSKFIGYNENLDAIIDARKARIQLGNAKTVERVVLEETPFYLESGGQVSDTGSLYVDNRIVKVIDVIRVAGERVHVLEPNSINFSKAKSIRAVVDKGRRINIQRNHSATHLIHEALRRVLGTHVHQQGSLVAPDHLRFDFPHFGKITPEEVRAIEEMVNAKIADDISVFTEVDMPIEKAKKIPNVKMFFGEKYGEIVRVVVIDENYSVEFCGGTHVKNTKDIGLFKIISESSIASGVRRIEAVTGEGVQKYIDDQLAKAQSLDDQLAKFIEEKEMLERELQKYSKHHVGTRNPSLGSITLPSSQSEAINAVEAGLNLREQTLEHITKQTLDLKKELSKHKVNNAAADIEALVKSAATLDARLPDGQGFKVAVSRIDAATMDELKSIGDTLRSKLGSGVGVLASIIEEKAAFVCVVTDDLIKSKNLQAGKIVGAMAKLVGGGGGGKPHLATAGGKEVAKLDEALAKAAEIVRSFV